MGEDYKKRIMELKESLLAYLGTNGRYYGELTRIEQSVEDLAQALNTRLDQLILAIECGSQPQLAESPSQRLANRFMETANKLQRGGRVDIEMADQFEQSLDLLDVAADLKRRAETVKDQADTAAFKAKRSRV